MGSGMGHLLWGRAVILRYPKPQFACAWVAICGIRLRSPFMGVTGVPRLGRPAPGDNPASNAKNPMEGYLWGLNSLSEYSHSA